MTTIAELIEQHANDPKALADAVERLTLERASDLCMHYAKLFSSAGDQHKAMAANALGHELRELAERT